MTKTRLRRGLACLILATVCGCGGSKHFSPAAVPIAVKMRDALAAGNTSYIAGEVESARQLFSSGAITRADLERFVLIKELGDGNSWNDAKKILEEGIAKE